MFPYTYAPQVLHVFGNALGWMRPHITERVNERIRAVLLGMAGLVLAGDMGEEIKPMLVFLCRPFDLDERYEARRPVV